MLPARTCFGVSKVAKVGIWGPEPPWQQSSYSITWHQFAKIFIYTDIESVTVGAESPATATAFGHRAAAAAYNGQCTRRIKTTKKKTNLHPPALKWLMVSLTTLM